MASTDSLLSSNEICYTFPLLLQAPSPERDFRPILPGSNAPTTAVLMPQPPKEFPSFEA
jgi:hypothetical protein